MTAALLIVCEAEADFHTASGLVDRVICDRVDWIDLDVIGSYRTWRGADDERSFLTWTEAAARARMIGSFGAAALGHFDGRPGEAYATRARRTLLLLQALRIPLDGVVLLIDDDREVERRSGLEQARASSPLTCPVVLGVAHLKRACWALAGFDPTDEHEQARLDQALGELTFDPRLHPERLTAKGDGEPRSAKRVLRFLVDGAEREADCWLRAALEVLRTRGQNTGLTAFLDEVEGRLVPLFDPTPPA
jgi:hypothetical protein